MEYVAISISVLTFIWTIVSYFLLNKENSKLQNQQANLEKGIFINNKQYETEMEILKELSLRLLRLYYAVYNLYPYGLYYESHDPEQKMEQRQKKYSTSLEEYGKFIDVLLANAAFLDESLYLEFDEIRKKMLLQINFYPDFMIREDAEMIKAAKDQYSNSWKFTEEIDNDRKEIINKIRIYLAKQKNGNIAR